MVQPQVIGHEVRGGRPAPRDADQPQEVGSPADIIIVAIGQGIGPTDFEQSGIKPGGRYILADDGTHLPDMEGPSRAGTASPAPPR